MKKILAIIALGLLFTVSMSAKGGFGVIGGFNFSTANFKEIDLNRSTMTQWHAGVFYKLDLPLGFAVQPALQYSVKGAKLGGASIVNADIKAGYIELPVSVQWGPDLILFRPYLDVTPFIGCGLKNSLSAGRLDLSTSWKDSAMKRFSYGVGVGAGVEVWKFNLVARYNWNLGSLYDNKISDSDGLLDFISENFTEGNFSGITLSVGFRF